MIWWCSRSRDGRRGGVGMVPIVLYCNSIAILWYCKISKHFDKYCKISKYCNTYCKIFQVLQKVFQNMKVLQKLLHYFQSSAKSQKKKFKKYSKNYYKISMHCKNYCYILRSGKVFKLCYSLLKFD